MSGSFYNSQELDPNLAFPILSWNSPDPDPIRAIKSNINNLPKPNINNIGSGSTVLPMQSMASQPASFSIPFELSYPDITPTSNIQNDVDNSVLSYNFFPNSYGKLN